MTTDGKRVLPVELRFALVAVVLGFASHARASKVRAPARMPAIRATAASPLPTVEMFALNTHEAFHLRPDANGHFSSAFMRQLSHFLRCHHTGHVHAMSPRLAELIYRTGRHFNRRLTVVAGYRAPKIAREKGNPKSPHKSGFACDFRVDGVANETLRDYVRGAFERVGVGYYPNSDFVHLDVRPGIKSAYWVDYSGPGERARYRAPVGTSPDRMAAAEEPEEIDAEPSNIRTVSTSVASVPSRLGRSLAPSALPLPPDSEESEIHVLSDTGGGVFPRAGGVRPRLTAIPPI